MLEEILKTVDFINEKTQGFKPEIGIVLGSGLGGLADGIDVQYEIAYEDIPGFPVSTVKGHNSKLLFGSICNRKVVAMQGRFHYYEGYTTAQVTFPIRVLKYLGTRFIILSNASEKQLAVVSFDGRNRKSRNVFVGDFMLNINAIGQAA